MFPLRLAAPTFINERSSRYYADIPEGWLSLKTMRKGSATYTIQSGRVTVDDDHYLILNERQPYEIRIERGAAVESFCVFFPGEWADDVYANFSTGATGLLDGDRYTRPVTFYDILHRHDHLVTPLVWKLKALRSRAELDEGRQAELVYALLAAMLRVQQQVNIAAAKLPNGRSGTRKELYRRLHIGRDYLRARLDSPVTLGEAANAAALSPYHFLRSFKMAFGRTPHAYLTGLRMQKARRLLAQTELPVTEICFSVGYRSLGSFSARFKELSGQSPSEFRQSAFRK